MERQKNDLRNMHCLDIYLMSLPHEEAQRVLKDIGPPTARFPLIGLGPPEVLRAERPSHELVMLRLLQRRYHWKVDLDRLLARRYDAIVLTDARCMTLWVDRGFRRMTGYAPKDAIGRSPSFLQGPLTDHREVQRLRDSLALHTSVRAELVNYRRNGEAYNCVIDIEPLRNARDEVTHFIAFEHGTS